MPNPTSISVLDSTATAQTISTMDALLGVFGGLTDPAWSGSGNATLTALAKAIANNALSTSPSPVQLGPFTNKTIAASQTLAVVGATGAVGDYLYGLEITPATTSPGAVTVYDGSSTVIYTWPGGSSSVTTLIPFGSIIAAKCVNTGWHVTTGANVSVRCIGLFN